MLYAKLKGALDHFCAVCRDLDIDYIPSYEESDLQSVLLSTKDGHTLNEIESALHDKFKDDSIHMDFRRVRGGTIASLSIEAINETEWDKILSAYYEETRPMTLKDKLDRVFRTPSQAVGIQEQKPIEEPMLPLDFYSSAKKIHEEQYKTATSGATRSNQSSRQRNMYGSTTTIGGYEHPSSRKKAVNEFKKTLLALEDLSGIATPTDNQPVDLFKRFGKALSVLGQQIGIGPIQQKLKERGINYKLSSDQQSIIMYVKNAETNAPQALLRIPAEALDQPHELEEQMMNMLDFAQGDAPGSLKQKQQAIQAREKAVRDIVSAMQPEKPDDTKSVLKNMLGSGAQV